MPKSLYLLVRSFILVIMIIAITGSVKGQSIIYDQNDITRFYYSNCYENNVNYFPSVTCMDSVKGIFNLLPIYINTLYNTQYAKSINDGPAWGGRGLNTTLGFGFSGRIGRVSYVLNPILHYSENRDFYTGGDLTNSPEFQNPYYLDRIDYVSRYGSDPFYLISPGQSEISINLNKIELAVATQNMRWGYSVYNPIIMSTNAPGFPHLKLGTSKPIKSKVGDFELNVFWGILEESEFFNSNPKDDTRYFSGINFGYRPGGVFEGFQLGFQRIFYAQSNYLTGYLYDGLIVFSNLFYPNKRKQVNGRPLNDYYDQIASITLSYLFPERKFHIYMEWAKGDFNSNLVDFLEQPEHNRAYTFGFTKGFEIGNDYKMLFLYENSSLGVWQTGFVRSSGAFYLHSVNTQGYTNNGQVIGASVGPGGQTNIATLSFESENFSIKLDYERSRYNDDYFYKTFIVKAGPSPQDIEHQIGLIYSRYYERIQIDFGSFYANRASYLFDIDTVLNNVHSFITFRFNL